MSCGSSNKKLKRTEEAFKLLRGTINSSDYAHLSLLVKESDSENILHALQGSTSKQFDWCIVEDETISDPQMIPSLLAHRVTMAAEDLPTKHDTSESELLEWLVQGVVSAKKCAILEFKDGRGGHEHYTIKCPFEVVGAATLHRFHTAATQLYNVSEPEGDMFYLVGCEVLDRGEFRRLFGKRKPHIVDDAMLERFEEDACEGNPHWAQDNRDLTDGFDIV